MVVCKICGSETYPVFKALVLNKYDVQYYKCKSCDFVQTEDAYWLSEAYSSAITSQDIGLLYRNNFSLPLLRTITKFYFDKNGLFVDYGGGYGVLVRLMRDSGFNTYRSDKYCNNLFAIGFDDDNTGRKYELLTAFEVFEHLDDPLAEVSKMLELSDNIFFSTEIQNGPLVKPDNWWYVMPETGQHIALYSVKSLGAMAEKLNLNFYTNGVNYHLLTKKNLNKTLFKLILKYKVACLLDRLLSNPASKLQEDYKLVK
jgi:hypothetical protein